MVSQHTKQVADLAKAIYATRLQQDLEANHLHRFVAIEPQSGEHFLANTFSQAVTLARTAHPERIAFVIHVGHEAAIHLGGMAT